MQTRFALASIGMAMALSLTAVAQDGNAIPQIEVVRWEVQTNSGTTVVYDDDLGIGTLNDINDYLHLERDRVNVRVRIVDGDWTVDEEGGGDTEAVYVRLRGVPIRAYAPPEPGPITAANDGFLPEEGDGLEPPPGQLELFFTFSFVVPDFVGRNQRRLAGQLDFDAAWFLQFAVSNEQNPEEQEFVNDGEFEDFFFIPCDLTVMDCTSFLVQAIENPEIPTPNGPPFADAGADRSALQGSTVRLDASRSFDSFNIGFDTDGGGVIEQDILNYTWEFIAGPVRVDPVQTSTLSPIATVVLNSLGTYVYRVTVDDNYNALPSQDTVTITVVDSLPPQNAPLAVIVGPASALPVGTIITLDGRQSSDPDGDPLKFRWTQTNSLGQALVAEDVFRVFQPLAGVDTAVSTWQAVSAGTFYFRLLVDDGVFVSTARFQVRVIESATAGVQVDQTGGADGGSAEENAGILGGATGGACGAGLLSLAAVPLAIWAGKRRRLN